MRSWVRLNDEVCVCVCVWCGVVWCGGTGCLLSLSTSSCFKCRGFQSSSLASTTIATLTPSSEEERR